MLPLFKAFFFCILLLGSVLIRGNNNLISPVVRQEFFYRKNNPSFIRKLMRAFSNVNLDFTYKSVGLLSIYHFYNTLED